MKNNNDLSHLYSNKQEHENALFVVEKSSITKNYQKEKLELEKVLEKKIKKKKKKKKKNKKKKKSILSKIINLLFKNKKSDNKVKLGKDKSINFIEKTNKNEKKLKQVELKKKIKEEKQKKQQEIQNQIKKNNETRKQEKKLKQEELRKRKEEEKINKIREKQRKQEEKKQKEIEKNILNENIKNNEKNESANKKNKELARKEKEEKKRLKREEKERKFKIKLDEKLKRKKEKEEKTIEIINKRREKENKIKKEREEAKKQRREKANLIKKAQEENRQKARENRKSLSEKINDWYQNLSFVKDAKNRKELERQTLLIDFDGEDAIRSTEKIMYKYVAKNKETGKIETGEFAAFSKLDVHSFLIADGYDVYEITPQKNLHKTITLFSPKFNSNELDFFLTQLSTFLKSGITLIESVKILSKQCKKSSQKNIYKSIIYELSMGENFSEALAKQGNIFPRLLINMVKTSELTGDLPETLDDMADYYREIEKTRKQMISALTYPAVVLVFAIGILIFIMVSVIPEFVSIYGDLNSDLPGITVAVISLSNFLQSNYMFLIIGFILFVFIFAVLFKTIKVFKTVIQTLLMNLPIFGKIIIYNEVTMFTKTFASLLNHNVYITDSMEVLSKVTNNEVYKMLIFDTIANLAKGEAISNSFKNHWAFPTIAYEMILTGEKTGQLGNMMDKVANYYQEQHKNAVNQIKAFVEPVMIVILAAIVGVVLLSVVLPMFDMYDSIG